ncbi:MAG: hypothetical protein OXG19_09780 [Chloroflexi bacterium]|nr:hypothetical protein [Chloroflexota bacterium]
MDRLIGTQDARTFFAARSPSVRKLGLDIAALSDSEMRRWMRQEPRLLRRPILKAGQQTLLGFNEAEWEKALR